ncbi:Guided Entry of Tail-anchored proteins 4 [Hibiscus trionum]|uniref:Guided Entry of Tail-anchored proteins 4 n=1 Tax=Hibiscus trionum TaxID=183268 RepID=A0A9W7LV44_HIBTR|nr:Guided Entry of Tail-anchored proteins 4 [Hibiscus trionum]
MQGGNQVGEKMSREKSRRANLPPVQANIDKLEEVINEGNRYGAQQMYKSISARYVSAERYSEALDLLHSGACLQLKHGEVTCGSELAVMFVDVLVKGKIPCDEETLDRILKIYKLFPKIPMPSNLAADDDVQQLTEAIGEAKIRLHGCSSFLKAAIKWSEEFGAQKNGDPQLHTMLAEYIYYESPEADMVKVSYHFARGNNIKKFATTLVNFMSKCYPGEDDIAIARAILMYLSLGNLQDANSLMDELRKQVQSQEMDFPASDLIHYINLLLLTLEKETLALFTAMRMKYDDSIDREPAFKELLDDIAVKFYGVQRRDPLQDMFGDMLKMM